MNTGEKDTLLLGEANRTDQDLLVTRQKLEEISLRIGFLRNIAILLVVFTMAVAIPSFVIQNVLSTQIKIWLLAVMVTAFSALLIALILVRKDSTATLFTSFLLWGICCIVLGIAVCSLQKIITGQH